MFSVNILHQYYLNKGILDFFGMNTADKEKQLAGYDVSNFFKITPSAETYQKMQNHRLVFKTVNTGFLVWVQVSENQETTPLISLDDTLELTFLLNLVNHTFFNYTKLDASNTGKLYHFSNKRLESEVPGFPLIRIASDNQSVNDDYILSDKGFEEITANLTNKEKQRLFSLIQIRIKGENASLDITNSQKDIRNPALAFQVVFENRKTYWRYFFNKDQKVKNKDDVVEENDNPQQLVTRTDHPLTEKGFVKIELDGAELPNPDASVIKPNGADNKIYSEIYM